MTMERFAAVALASVALLLLVSTRLSSCEAFAPPPSTPSPLAPALLSGVGEGAADAPATEGAAASRRAFFSSVAAAAASSAVLGAPSAATAAPPDCLADCVKNCQLIAPKDPEYCRSSCAEYCDRPDRTDGLSGSVSSAGGETGILGTTTVVKGEDKPPGLKLPGLDFTSGSGRKLLGY